MTESVWDYPRPPRVETVSRRVQIVHRGVTVADTTRALRVLETSHPPVYYIPPEDVRADLLAAGRGTSFCEWKGAARYHDLVIDGARVPAVAWSYPRPMPGFETIRDHLAFYPGKVDEALVGGERARPQAGGFYGGWITADLVGPFKGEPGTQGW
jgi:uncharacterized protein (DUF427 family)